MNIDQTLMFPGQKPESRVHVTEGGTLSIQSARVEDSGEYSCQALNAAGSSFANAHITVTGTSADMSACPSVYYSVRPDHSKCLSKKIEKYRNNHLVGGNI